MALTMNPFRNTSNSSKTNNMCFKNRFSNHVIIVMFVLPKQPKFKLFVFLPWLCSWGSWWTLAKWLQKTLVICRIRSFLRCLIFNFKLFKFSRFHVKFCKSESGLWRVEIGFELLSRPADDNLKCSVLSARFTAFYADALSNFFRSAQDLKAEFVSNQH